MPARRRQHEHPRHLFARWHLDGALLAHPVVRDRRDPGRGRSRASPADGNGGGCMTSFTARQSEALAFDPSYNGIATRLGFASRSGVHQIIGKLEERGGLRKPAGKAFRDHWRSGRRLSSEASSTPWRAAASSVPPTRLSPKRRHSWGRVPRIRLRLGRARFWMRVPTPEQVARFAEGR